MLFFSLSLARRWWFNAVTTHWITARMAIFWRIRCCSASAFALLCEGKPTDSELITICNLGQSSYHFMMKILSWWGWETKAQWDSLIWPTPLKVNQRSRNIKEVSCPLASLPGNKRCTAGYVGVPPSQMEGTWVSMRAGTRYCYFFSYNFFMHVLATLHSKTKKKKKKVS